MKTFGLFMLLFFATTVLNSLLLRGWSTPEIIIHSTLFAYIMQQYFTKEIKNK
jgi:hypothetical protein